MTPWLVPSPLLSMVARAIATGKKTFVPAELGNEGVLTILTPPEREHIASLVVDRIARNGTYMSAIRGRPLGTAFRLNGTVRLEHLSQESTQALRRAKDLELDALHEMHWGDILSKPRGTVSRPQLIMALAEVEWRNNQATGRSPDAPDLRQQITELLRDPRIDDIRDTDLRYSWRHLQPHGSLVKFLGELRTREVSQAERRYVDKLWLGFQLTLAQDIENIGYELASRTLSQTAARLRAAEVFAVRFGARAQATSREAMAKHFGVTMAWINITLARVIDARGEATLASPAASRLLQLLRDNEFLSVPLLEEKLGLCSGGGDSLVTFRSFLKRVVHPSPVFEARSGIHTQAADVLTKERNGVSSATVTTRHHALIRTAKRQFRAAGAASLTQLAGVVALEGKSVSRADIERIVEELPGAQWLDSDRDWFVLDDLADSLVYSRVRKILAVAQKPVSIRDIGEALYRDPRLAEETDGQFPLAPVRILKLAMLKWPGVEEPTRTGFLVDRRQTPPADVLSPNELALYETLAARGGIGPTEAVIRETDPDNAASLRSQLANSVFVYSPVSGVSALRGWRITRSDLLGALAESSLAGQPDRAGPTLMVIRPN